MRANLAAWTDPEWSPTRARPLVKFVSINQERLDEVLVAVRDETGAQVEVAMPTAAFRKLAAEAYAATSGHDP